MNQKPLLSVVATIYKAEGTVDVLVKALLKELTAITESFEIILVEDGSPDFSWQAIEKAGESDKRVKGMRLSRNFGQQLAMSAGMRHATGDYVIIMDGDLQNPPEAIPVILAELKKGFDIVYTVADTRNNRRDEMSSKLFWYFLNNVLGVGMIPNQLMMKGFTKRFIETFNLYDEKIRAVSGITHDIGFPYSIIRVENKKRLEGRSNYTLLKRFHLMVDIVLAITTQPLSYLINLSLFGLLLTILISVWTLINYIITPEIPPGYTTLLLVVSFFGNFTLLVLGIMGKYLAGIYIEVRKRPLFLTQKTINID